MKKNIASILQNIIEKEFCTIQSFIAEEALNYIPHIDCFFEDLHQYGCQSGLIGSVIYNRDIDVFFDEHYSEIEEIRQEYYVQHGKNIEIGNQDLKTAYVWFAIETTAFDLAHEIDIF
ncbi:MAG: DUF7222 domain-containing protein [Saprospiraceae bacterium]